MFPLAGASYNPSTQRQLQHLLRRVQARQFNTPSSASAVLHWCSERDDLCDWAWPVDLETGGRIPPSELEGHRRTHFFRAPNCLCAYLLDQPYIEAQIGLVYAPRGREGSILNGEYVAECATKRCGYFGQPSESSLLPASSLTLPNGFIVNLEKVFSQPVLQQKSYLRRSKPLAGEQLTYLSDFDSKFNDSLGLYKAAPTREVVSHGTKAKLDVGDPMDALGASSKFVSLYSRGLQEDDFWSLFMQCAHCSVIMPRDVFWRVHTQVLCEQERKLGQDGEVNASDSDSDVDSNSLSGDTEIIGELE
ncbi:hypothetical protein FA15DRAFT_700885 [Coprinopsis marcescibilis]|uniref:Uncharacterized protein n=1 Tax=Coprinopsis marcescibilis TaxID=230819 RepID=A0A5C3L7F8_COPMA|nr:hypothetical protein FA15DRAFT_700885 [Coprinopsis marcescibilis]